MAAESPIAKLAAKPPKVQAAILAGILVFIMLAYHQIYYSSLSEELASAQDAYARLEKDQVKAKNRQVEWEKMINDKKDLDRTLSANMVSLPATASLASFYGHLQNQAAIAGVTFKNMSLMKEIPVVGYVKVPIAIEVLGNFHQILKFFYLLGRTKRIITVENFSVSPGSESGGHEVMLKAEFQATTFRQVDGAQPVRKVKPKSGIINKVKGAKEKREKQVEDATGGKTDENGNPVKGSAKSSGVK